MTPPSAKPRAALLKIQKVMTLFQKQAAHEARNREAAELILADVSRHGGEESAIVQWARVVSRELRGNNDDAGPRRKRNLNR